MDVVTPSGVTPKREQAAFNVFAYQLHDRTTDTRKDNIPTWDLHRLQAWVERHQFDVILLERSDKPATGRPGVVHHYDCSDSTCPGGC